MTQRGRTGVRLLRASALAALAFSFAPPAFAQVSGDPAAAADDPDVRCVGALQHVIHTQMAISRPLNGVELALRDRVQNAMIFYSGIITERYGDMARFAIQRQSGGGGEGAEACIARAAAAVRRLDIVPYALD